MKPWMIERTEQERQQRRWQPLPLRIQQPPPEWIEEQERRQREEHERQAPRRGVVEIDFSI